MGVDWSERSEYILAKHGVGSRQADEALDDPDRVVFDPDPASQSGVSVRTIGYSAGLDGLVTVITVTEVDGTAFGINAWPSNPTDQRRYRERNWR